MLKRKCIRVTSWSTGNRLVDMTVIRKSIPSHMSGRYRGQLISVNTWYQGQGETTGEHLLLRSNGVFSVAQLITKLMTVPKKKNCVLYARTLVI